MIQSVRVFGIKLSITQVLIPINKSLRHTLVHNSLINLLRTSEPRNLLINLIKI